MPDTKKKYTENTDKVIGEGFNPTANVDAVGGFNYDAWNDGGSGIGSKSNIETLAEDYVNSNYDNFTQGDDYASLAKRYSQQGQQAMKDTLGQVSARTGGYASSYATQAAQQSYNGYMEKLEDAARSLYDSQMAEKANKLGVAQGLYDTAYGEHRQNVTDAQWRDGVASTARRDKISDAQWLDDQEMRADEIAKSDAAEALTNFQNDVYTDLYLSENIDNMTWDEYSKSVAVPDGFEKRDFDMLKQQVIAAKTPNEDEPEFHSVSSEDFEYYGGLMSSASTRSDAEAFATQIAAVTGNMEFADALFEQWLYAHSSSSGNYFGNYSGINVNNTLK